ncbi:50S ribosomal protein L25/general stress protein Ctc [Brevibacterium jeotgali]|uniref:Large ribosomal subunit protein bL25 n=1 Tax=Brevibacterium jeotgali TaxID=1262550 RepID=A0A2H1L6R2_9MICO|nr:50S ribosomal protein L25/general stress protein Ctc [Brevibacterium jeotgali]TWB99028.1 LSU ribosomal protein L25P [Brevibacterium jeotgali]SMY12465.1 large subunit ribosomal protein L25 [Brevibacterium jeotgali]
MADVKLDVVRREEFGKGAARRYRRAGKVPAVFYGHGIDPIHLLLDAHPTMLALRTPNALLKLENPNTGKSELALVKDVQVNPLTRENEHLDLILVKKGEKVEVDVPVVLEGEAAPGTMVSVDNQSLVIEADATKLPETIEVDIEGREVGDHIYAADVAMPSGSTLVSDPELLVVNVSAQLSDAELEAELETDAVDEDAAGSTDAEPSDDAGASAEEKSADE